ncbi:MAG TPA: hypothetical protein VGN72_22375 [Tepidisphaeraceae bacterium]|jgi:hypothetical protein|nr:hypothetical protein [Tepidisphaeraceae bacterium]
MANLRIVSLACLCVAGTLGARVAVAQTVAPTTMPSGLPATLVSFSGEDVLAEEAFLAIGKQAGVRFATQPNNLWDSEDLTIPMSVDLKDRPFWSAVRALCADADVQPNQNYGGGGPNAARRVTLTQQNMMGHNNRTAVKPWTELPTFEVDGFLVQAIAFNRQQSINYQVPEQGHNMCSVQLTAYVDPAIRVASFNGAARVEEAIDDNGNSMVIDDKSRNVQYGSNNQRGLTYQVHVPLKYPTANPGKKIAKLRCTLILRGGDKMDTLAVDKPLEAAKVSKAFGDMTITFHELKKMPSAEGQPAQYQLRIGISRDDERGGADTHNLLQSAQLVDDKGVALSFHGGGGGGNNVYTFNYSARNNEDGQPTGEPVRWSIELPSDARVMRIPVEFKDLPMP